MGKAPAFQFYPADFDRDTKCLSLEATGAWMRILNSMWWAEERGILRLPMIGYQRLFGCSEEQASRVIDELLQMRVCDTAAVTEASHVTERDKIVTLINRRMVREEKERQSHKLRQERYRSKQDSDGDVTVPSSSSSSSSDTEVSSGADFIHLFFEKYQQAFSEKYLVNGKKDGALAKRLVDHFGMSKLAVAVDRFFASTDPFIVGSGHTIGVFYSQVNKLILGRTSAVAVRPATKAEQLEEQTRQALRFTHER